ncbi:hypothetical protein Xmau_02515 [Xenorhabdus mauleonii]|uniref:Uncharacterized protein n=1 Tax=Xenorhabdus mauleonii TaxID=351675 RepID=A0A1I3RHC0_9GAMM|nr:hypothetical protein Xmau_02515 [Xenorhabdus mauleonii]SFJ46014.1 hypothetical protein SAMN05421680_109150 [Xenorhabdus mauleonii]
MFAEFDSMIGRRYMNQFWVSDFDTVAYTLKKGDGG